MPADPCAGPGATHHEACPCREEAIARLCEQAEVAAEWIERQGQRGVAKRLTAAVAEVRGPREERKGMAEPRWEPTAGDWYIPRRGKVAHKLRGRVGGRLVFLTPWCVNVHEGAARQATNADPRCKRCEERGDG